MDGGLTQLPTVDSKLPKTGASPAVIGKLAKSEALHQTCTQSLSPLFSTYFTLTRIAKFRFSFEISFEKLSFFPLPVALIFSCSRCVSIIGVCC